MTAQNWAVFFMGGTYVKNHLQSKISTTRIQN